MSEITYRQAITQALADELDADESVILLGEDIGAAGGVFKATDGLLERFGAERVMDTPISEQAIVGAAIGAAARGLRPIAEIMFADFAGVCFDQIANQLAKYRYMSGGQVTIPATVRLGTGGSLGFAAQHSQPVENWFLNVPGLKIVTPGDPASAYGLLRSAIQDPNPVLFFEHKALYGRKGPPPTEEALTLGEGAVLTEGSAVTVVANQLMLGHVLDAAEQMLSEDGTEVEVIDPRTLMPFDLHLVMTSIEKTHRLVCVQEGSLPGSWAASLIASVVEHGFELLDAPPRAVSADRTPLPYARSLEEACLPSSSGVAESLRAVLDY